MAFYRTKKTKPPAEAPANAQFPGPVDIGYGVWDTVMAPLQGLWQGVMPKSLGGGNMNFDEHARQRDRRRRNRPPSLRPQSLRPRRRAAENWLTRTIKGS